jgi:hypothetical protein
MNGMIGSVAQNELLYGEIIQRRNAISRDLKSLQTDVSPYSVAEVVDRNKTGLPDDFAPWAPAIMIASDYLLGAANYRPGGPDPEGWSRKRPWLFTKNMHRNTLIVRQCGAFWSVERADNEVLAFRYGAIPIFTRTYQAAMRLAEYCHLPAPEGKAWHAPPGGAASRLHWVVSTPSGIRWLN